MKRIGNSKWPTEEQLKNVVHNLREKFGRYASVEIWARESSTTEFYLEIRVAFVHGFKGNACSSVKALSWPLFLDLYKKLMKGNTDILDNT